MIFTFHCIDIFTFNCSDLHSLLLTAIYMFSFKYQQVIKCYSYNCVLFLKREHLPEVMIETCNIFTSDVRVKS